MSTGSDMTVTNSAFYNNMNTASSGTITIGNGTGYNLDIYNCSFYNNEYPIIAFGTATVDVYNSIFYNNDQQFWLFGPSPTVYNANSCILQNTSNLTGNVNNLVGVDPVFIDPDNGDLRLDACSPAINAGANALVPYDVNDIDGDSNTTERLPFDLDYNNRLYSIGTVDMGAYEYQGLPLTNTRFYVDKDATGLNDGSSWANAFTDLTEALNIGANCSALEEIWVAEGTYYPTAYPRGCTQGCASSADYTFHLMSDVKLYGGFQGNETMLQQRNYNSHPTILSGDIDLSGTNTFSDALHVLISTNDTDVLIDGFTIRDGYAYAASSTARTLISGYSSYIQDWYAGAIFVGGSDVTIQNVKLVQNYSRNYGNALYNLGGNIAITNSLFNNNKGASTYATIFSFQGAVAVTNSTFYSNRNVAFQSTNGDISFDNCILYNNNYQFQSSFESIDCQYSILQNSGNVTDLGNNQIGINPYYVDASSDDFTLQTCSPAIDAGSNALISADSFDIDSDANLGENIPYDLANNNRQYLGGIVDLGAYEYQGNPINNTVALDAINACDSTLLKGVWYTEPTLFYDTVSLLSCFDSIVQIEISISNCTIESYCERQKVYASDGAASDRYGERVDVFRDWAIIGSARSHHSSLADAGAAYIYRKLGDSWTFYQKITASDAASNDYFGSDVAVSDNVLAVGAYGEDDNGSAAGAVYIYRYNGATWVEEAKLLASDGGPGDNYGASVDIAGNIVVVGAKLYDNNLSNDGGAYVYQYNGTTWEEQQILTGSGTSFNDYFGFDVVIEGELIVVGAPEFANATDYGGVYVFRYDGTMWVQEQKLQASDLGADDNFGNSVDIQNGVIVVGAPDNDDNGASSGAAYIFTYNGSIWIESLKLLASNADVNDEFGYSVAIDGVEVLIGASRAGVSPNSFGAVYRYRWNGTTWVENDILVANDGANKLFGADVAISNNSILIGGTQVTGNTSNSGAAYFFQPTLTNVYDTVTLYACDSAIVNGNTYYTSQRVNDTFQVNLCQDSIVTTILTIEDGSATITCPTDTTVIESGGNCSVAIILPVPEVVLGECLQNTGLNFDGIDDKININYLAGFVIGSNPRTFETWVRSTNSGSISNLFTYGSSSASTKWLVQINASGQLNLLAGTINKTWNTNLYDGNWHHIAVVHDGGDLTNTLAYVDGALVAAINNPTSTPSTGNSTVAGVGASYFSPYNYFEGDLDEVRYWDDARTALEIQNNMNVELVGNEANLILYYNFEQGESCGNNVAQYTLLDVASTPTANNGSLSNFSNLAGNLPAPCISNYANGYGVDAAGLYNDYNGTSDASDTYPEGTTTVNWTYVTIYGDSVQCSQNVTVQCLNGTPNAVNACDSALINGNWYFETQIVYDTIGANDSIVVTELTISSCGDQFCENIKAVASDRGAGDQFGSVAVFGDYAIVGAQYDDEDASGGNTLSNAGAAYIYKKNAGSWTQVQKIVASDRAVDDWFGWSVAISGDYAFVGAYVEDEDANNENTVVSAGSVYIFKNNAGTWTEVQKIVPSEREVSDWFGVSISISGDYAIIGAWQDEEEGEHVNTQAGSAYVFKNNGGTWVEVQKLLASDRANGDYFGFPVAVSGDYAIVGASNEDEDASGGNTLSDAGSAYIFKNNAGTWTEVQKIVPSDREAGDRFGYSLDISDDYAIVGAHQEDDDVSGGNTLNNAGSAYIFLRTIQIHGIKFRRL